MRITDFSSYAYCNYPENHSKKISPAAGFKYRNQLCLLVNTPKKFSLRRASLLGVCLHNVVYLCIHARMYCICPPQARKFLGIQTFIQREMHRVCPPQARKFWVYRPLYKGKCVEFARRRREFFWGFIAAIQGEIALL